MNDIFLTILFGLLAILLAYMYFLKAMYENLKEDCPVYPDTHRRAEKVARYTD